MQRRQKTKPCPDPRECWDLGTGLRTQAKELMGLLEAHTVVSAKAKLAGSKPTLREVEADLRRGEAGARQLLHNPRNPLLPSQEPRGEPSPLGHRLRGTVAT